MTKALNVSRRLMTSPEKLSKAPLRTGRSGQAWSCSGVRPPQPHDCLYLSPISLICERSIANATNMLYRNRMPPLRHIPLPPHHNPKPRLQTHIRPTPHSTNLRLRIPALRSRRLLRRQIGQALPLYPTLPVHHFNRLHHVHRHRHPRPHLRRHLHRHCRSLRSIPR